MPGTADNPPPAGPDTTDAPPAAAALLSALAGSGESFALFDADDRLVYANARTREIFPEIADHLDRGRTYEELLRLYADRHPDAPPPGPEREARVQRGLARHRVPQGSYTIRTPGGRWLLASERPLPDGGVVSIHTDVTALKHREAELRASEAEALAARAAAERANRAKVEFLAHMSRELRTPLSAVLGVTRIMLDEALGPLGNGHYREYVNDIHDSGEHLLELVSDLLDLTRIEAGRMELRDEAMEAAAIVTAAADAVRTCADERGLTLEVDTGGDLPLLLADATAVRQMVDNLVDNALTHTPAGGCVSLSAARLADGGIGIMIADTGPGIAADILAAAREPFGRADGFRTTLGRGTGLGLPLVHRLVELHGGRLALHSEAGVGTTAILQFPPARSLPRVLWPPPELVRALAR